MEPYIKQWLSVIDGMNNSNTYKLAWGRAIVELCHVYDGDEDPVIFRFEQIGEYVLKYFWNQTYFFKLFQGQAKSRFATQRIKSRMSSTV